MTSIRRLLKGSAPQKVVFLLSQSNQDLNEKVFFICLATDGKQRQQYQRHGEAQLSKKYGNVTIDLPSITRLNPIETETVILEDPLPEEKQQEDFELSSKEKKEELQFHINLEVNTLPDKEIKLIKGNGMLTDLPFDKCQKILENQFHDQNELQDTLLGQKLCSMN